VEKLSFSKTPDHGLVASLIEKYSEMGEDMPRLGKSTLQKLCYLGKARGIPFSLYFDIQHYGPFSAQLFLITDDLMADGVISCRRIGTGEIQYTPGPACKVLLKKQKSVLDREEPRLNIIVRFFHGVPSQELELVTSIHYIYCSQKIFRNPSEKAVINNVFEIKKGKFTRDVIRSRFSDLDRAGLLKWSPKTAD
jgi:uncharacterized protein